MPPIKTSAGQQPLHHDPDCSIWVPDALRNPAPALVVGPAPVNAGQPQLGLTSLDPALLSRDTRAARQGQSWVVTSLGTAANVEVERVITTIRPCRSIPHRMLAGLAPTYPVRTSAEPVALSVPPADWASIGHLWDRPCPRGCLIRRRPDGANFCAVLWVDVHRSRRGWSLAEARSTEHLVSCTNGAIHSFNGRPRGTRDTQVRRAEGLTEEWFSAAVINTLVVQEFLTMARPRIIVDRLRQM